MNFDEDLSLNRHSAAAGWRDVVAGPHELQSRSTQRGVCGVKGLGFEDLDGNVQKGMLLLPTAPGVAVTSDRVPETSARVNEGCHPQQGLKAGRRVRDGCI